MLDISEGIHDLGTINWELALCLLLAWVCVFLVLLRGIKSFGKVVFRRVRLRFHVLTLLTALTIDTGGVFYRTLPLRHPDHPPDTCGHPAGLYDRNYVLLDSAMGEAHIGLGMG